MTAICVCVHARVRASVCSPREISKNVELQSVSVASLITFCLFLFSFEEHPLVLDTGTFDLVEVYHPARNTWRQALPMPAGLHGLYPVVHNEIMYVIGGGPFIDRFSSRNFFKYAPVDATKA
eukprot:TRINITY_DN9880_c0_g1_i1.p2 TRINITY_DN9880_c0_g1~~TRINITY_DN9880_c0_g1_i1.p2  ORF type:complete len:122 (+),score=19.92 TRINITY_DN9880_c0_g1_i1:1781-2146(+)